MACEKQDIQNKNSILIIDDEKINLQILARILGSEYTIYTAANGLDGIEIAKNCKPDLILLDILIPGMDGYETLIELKSCAETKHIRVIFITSLNNSEDEEKGLSLEAADYITKPFSDNVVKLRVQNQIQIINQFRFIEHHGMIDQLTNIPNRRGFDNRLQIEWNHAIREKTPISILMMDIDNFKYLNDTYGHQWGDIVLQKTAEVFLSSLKRSGDLVARWGGEEFVVLLPNTPQSGAIDIAERIRVNLENTMIPYTSDQVLKITISIGVNSLIPLQSTSVSDFISDADKRLYHVKQTGKNGVHYL
ncbi:MAG: diguanylate cyclase [Treponema sp.]|nr:diguanylate cyclase [Treponema sp.]